MKSLSPHKPLSRIDKYKMEAIETVTPAFKVPALSEEHQLLNLIESFNRAKTTGYLSLFQGLRAPYHEMHNLFD